MHALHALIAELEIACNASKSGNNNLAGLHWQKAFKEIDGLMQGHYHDTVPNMIQQINQLSRQGFQEVASLMRSQIARSIAVHCAHGNGQSSILAALDKLDFNHMEEVEERIMKIFLTLFDFYLGSRCYNSFVMLMNSARRRLARSPWVSLESCLPDLSGLDQDFGPSNRRPLDVIRIRVETLYLRVLYLEVENEALVLAHRADRIQNDPWQRFYFLTKAWYHIGSAQFSLKRHIDAKSSFFRALWWESEFSTIDESGMFNPEVLHIWEQLGLPDPEPRKAEANPTPFHEKEIRR